MTDSTSDKKIATLKILMDNQQALLNLLEKVDTDLFLHQPDGDKWSIAGLVEHIILVEHGVLSGIKKAGNQPQEVIIEKPLEEEQFRQLMRNRTRKIEAPKHFVPKGIFTDKVAAMEAFNTHRAQIIDFVNTTDIPLAFIGFPHFVLGVLNGFDWLVFMAGHCERHILQMEEIKLS